MNDPCKSVRTALTEMLAGGSPSIDPDEIERHLDQCPDCRREFQGLLQDDRLLNGFISSVDDRINLLEERIMESINANTVHETPKETTAKRPTPLFNRRIMRFAATAAVIVAGLIIGIRLTFWPGAPNVAWADVIRQVEEARDFICHSEKSSTGEPDLEMVQYSSAEHGLRIDIFRGGTLVAAQHLKANSNVMSVIIHRDRSYTLVEISDEQRRMMEKRDAKGLVEHFRSMDFDEIGTRTIDGVQASGIEVRDPDDFRAIFDESVIRLWVDARTNWPVRLEWEAVAKGGEIRSRSVLDRFEWNPSFTKKDFAFEIPNEYTFQGRMEEVKKDEASAIEGLREYAAYSRGRYPSTLSYATALYEMDDDMRKGTEVKEYIEHITKIQNSCAFYADLVDNDRDAAYYGDDVDSRDYDRVLLRWRLDDGRYRVIYGDLRSETVTTERLAELEADN